METFNSDKLNDLFAEKRWNEAKDYIADCLNSDLSNEEIGGMYVGIISAYMDLSTEANEGYLADLKEIIEALKDIDKIQSSTERDAQIIDVKQKIQDL